MASNENPKPPTFSRGVPTSRVNGPTGVITRVGIGGVRFGDVYHVLLTRSWPEFMAMLGVAYLLINTLFAVIFVLVGGIENARQGNFADAFFFSVETLGTIGYGKMSPVTTLANAVMTVESVTGLLSVALTTGLIFAKFARPTARVMWSNVLVIARRDGVPTLMFRMANERSNQIIEANFRLTMLADELTKEGERVRRLHDLSLTRSSTPTFNLTFTAMHRITPDSILYGKTHEDLAKVHAQFVCSLSGMDDTMNALVHARRSYGFEDVRWGHRFVDILAPLRDGERIVDYTKFHDAAPEAAE